VQQNIFECSSRTTAHILFLASASSYCHSLILDSVRVISASPNENLLQMLYADCCAFAELCLA